MIKKKAKSKKNAWFIVLAFLVFLLMSGVGSLAYWTYHLVGTPEGARRLIAWAQRALSEYASTDISFNSVSLSSLYAVEFKGLKIHYHPQGSQLEILAEQVSWEFDFSQLKRRAIGLRQFTLKNTEIKGLLTLSAQQEQNSSEDLETKLAKVRRVIEHPLFYLEWQKLAIDDLSVYLKVLDGNQHMAISLPHIALKLSGQLMDGHWESAFQSTSFRPMNLQGAGVQLIDEARSSWILWYQRDKAQALLTRPQWTVNFTTQLKQQGNIWSHQLDAREMTLTLLKTELFQGNNALSVWRDLTAMFPVGYDSALGLESRESYPPVTLARQISVNGNLSLQAECPAPLTRAEKMWSQLQGAFKISLQGLKSQGPSGESTSLDNLISNINIGEMNDTIQTSLRTHIDKLKATEFFPLPLKIAIDQHVTLPDLMTTLEGNLSVRVNDRLQVMEATYEVDWKQSLKAKFQAALLWQKELLANFRPLVSLASKLGSGRVGIDLDLETRADSPAPQRSGGGQVQMTTYLRNLLSLWKLNASVDMTQTKATPHFIFHPIQFKIAAGPDEHPGTFSFQYSGPKVNWGHYKVKDSRLTTMIQPLDAGMELRFAANGGSVSFDKDHKMENVNINFQGITQDKRLHAEQSIGLGPSKVIEHAIDGKLLLDGAELEISGKWQLDHKMTPLIGVTPISNFGTWTGTDKITLSAFAEADKKSKKPFSWQDFMAWDKLVLKGQGHWEMRQGGPAQLLTFKSPIGVEGSFQYKSGKLESNASVKVPTIDWHGIAGATATEGRVRVALNQVPGKIQGIIETDLSQGKIKALTAFGTRAGSWPEITGIKASSRVKIDPNGDVVLQASKLSLADGVVDISAEGYLSPKKMDGNLSGQMLVKGKRQNIFGHQINGQLAVPWRTILVRGKKAKLTGDIAFSDFSWMNPEKETGVIGLDGSVGFSEDLVLHQGRWQFAKILDMNPFLRVDFEQMQPLMADGRQLKIERIDYAGKKYGPMISYTSLKQNLLSAHKFDLKVGDGEVVGELFLDVRPGQQVIGLLSRVSRLNLSKSLPQKFRGTESVTNEKILSARMALDFQWLARSLNGRIDINEIDGDQVSTLIDALDPEYKDQTFNMARTGLSFAYPTRLAMIFNHGFMDFDLTLAGLAQGEFSVKGIYVTPLISSKMDEVLEKLKKGDDDENGI